MSGKKRVPRRSSPKIDSSKTDLTGKYYGQSIPDRGTSANDLYGLLSKLTSGSSSIFTPSSVGGSATPDAGTGTARTGLNLHSMYGDESSYADLINGSYGTSDFVNLLKSLGINYDHEMSGKQDEDWNKQLLNLILQQYVNQEQRGYDRSVLQEQRIFDSPINQLARLMGAGISRDAAIQMLSGSGLGSGSGSALIGSMGGTIDPGIPASQSELNNIQGKTAIANTVFGGIGALSGLVGLGFSVPQAIQQTKYLQNQNLLTERQISAYDSTGRAFSILNSAGAAAESFGSVASAATAITNLAKSGNADAAQFIASGGLQTMKENAPFSSQALGNLYMSERSSVDNARFIEQQQRANDLRNWISENDVTESYISVGQSFMQLLQEEPKLAQLWQDVQAGKYKILIAGEELKQEQYQTTVAENAAKQAAFDTEVLERFKSLGTQLPDGSVIGASDFIAYSKYQDLYKKMYNDAVLLGDPRWMSKEQVENNRSEYVKFLSQNRELAYMTAFVDLAFKQSDAKFIQSWASPFLGFGHALQSSGLGGVVSTATSTASDVAVPLLLSMP